MVGGLLILRIIVFRNTGKATLGTAASSGKAAIFCLNVGDPKQFRIQC